MNSKIIYPLLFIGLTVYACSENKDDAEKIKKELNETVSKIQELNDKKFKLEEELAKVDSTFKKKELNAVTFATADTSDFINFVEVQGNIEAD